MLISHKASYIIKIGTALAGRAIVSPLCLLPIRKKRVLFQSFREKQYACNPRYISEALERLCPGELEIGWAFRQPEKFAYLRERGIRVMQSGSWEAIQFALTAKVVCVNTYYKPTLPRRRGQYFLRTWHGGGAYKRVGSMAKMEWYDRVYIGMQQSGANLYLSSSKMFTDLVLRKSFGYTGEVMEEGMPRNDLLVRGAPEEMVRAIRERIGLKDGEHLALYAPTYRDDTQVHAFGLDYAALTDALSARFGGAWRAGFRSHHVTMYYEKGDNTHGALDLTDYPDMQELLLAADVLVTDYSSSIWDMSLAFKPTFLYCPDLDRYRAERDFYIDIHEWPFPLAADNAALASNIRGFDEEKYRADVAAHHARLGSCETGHASEAAARRIMQVCGVTEKN